MPGSEIGEARSRILAAMTALMPSLPPWRFHKYPPQEVASPCVWIDLPTVSRQSPWVVVTFPIVIALDGSDRAQAQAFDVALAQIWDALNAVPDVTVSTATPWARDIGGPLARFYVLSADVDVSADTLCLSPLYTDSIAREGERV